jgi:hypothetical protein
LYLSFAFAFAVAVALALPLHSQESVISTEATDSFIVRRAVERPPAFSPLLLPLQLLLQLHCF